MSIIQGSPRPPVPPDAGKDEPPKPGGDEDRQEDAPLRLPPMEWDKYLKRYVWNEDKTPYFIPVGRLKRSQAHYEVYAYSLFLGLLFAVVAVAASTDIAPHGRAPGVSFYAFTVVCVCVIFGFTKNYLAALYCAATPVAAILYLFVYGFPPKLDGLDHALILVLLVLWLRYSFRIVAIARHYPDLPDSR